MEFSAELRNFSISVRTIITSQDLSEGGYLPIISCVKPDQFSISPLIILPVTVPGVMHANVRRLINNLIGNNTWIIAV